MCDYVHTSLFFVSDSYQKAREKINKAEDTDNLDSTDAEGGRKRKQKEVWSPASTSSSEFIRGSMCASTMLPGFPKPPTDSPILCGKRRSPRIKEKSSKITKVLDTQVQKELFMILNSPQTENSEVS